MNRWERWSLHISTVVISVTGVVYFWMKYLMETNDPFSVVNHPLQPTMLEIHILASPVLIFAVGLIANAHIIAKLRNGSKGNRRSGWVALLFFPLMVLSGYLLQVVTDEIASRVALVLHLAAGAIFAGAYLVHQILTFRLWCVRLKRRLKQRQK